ncbi:hypothetical protein HS088_TW12G00082 [Tripterygium wilfordii]|uniref:Uncharacterized protein n=1 Tax=Tripterygium wilfordii TaxID=458696 RepID=A0A7J7CXQ5_TRIWF|nr:hypothetical protein HS088_TW12G00082 [Tripterygium wilfordii]
MLCFFIVSLVGVVENDGSTFAVEALVFGKCFVGPSKRDRYSHIGYKYCNIVFHSQWDAEVEWIMVGCLTKLGVFSPTPYDSATLFKGIECEKYFLTFFFLNHSWTKYYWREIGSDGCDAFHSGAGV